LLGATLLAVALLAASCSGSTSERTGSSAPPAETTAETQGDSSPPPSTSSPVELPETTSAPTATNSSAPDEALLDPDALSTYVEDVRRVELVGRAGQALIVDDDTFFGGRIDAPEYIEPSAWRSLRVLGLTDQNASYEAEMRARSAALRGACCPSQLRAGLDDITTAFVTVHELTHQADRQLVSQGQRNRPIEIREVTVVELAIDEGNAHRVAAAWANTLPPDARDSALGALEILPADGGPEISAAAARIMTFGYDEGRLFTQALVEDGGEDAVDTALANAPVVSALVLFPQRYIDGIEAPLVPAPTAPAGAESVGTHRLGAFGLLLLAEQTMTPVDARSLAGAWAGDAMTGWTGPTGEECVSLDLMMEDAQSADAAAGALGDDAVVDQRRVTLSRCVSGAG